MNILGVRIDNVTLEQAKDKALEFLNFDKQYKIFTPNPEMLVDAQKDEYFKEVLNSGDLNLCDGFGLALVSGCKRITGIDFMLEICQIAEKEGRGVYLLGSGSDEVIKKIVENLQKQFPKLKIVGYEKGASYFVDKKSYELIYDQVENNKILYKINSLRPDILFVAFGHNKQEKWIYENLSKMPSVKIAMGVGGAFDYISGSVKRAPCWLRKIGLEWMYRLIKQPKRAGRIFKATFKFLYYVGRSRKNDGRRNQKT